MNKYLELALLLQRPRAAIETWRAEQPAFAAGRAGRDVTPGRDSSAGRAAIFRNVVSLHPFLLWLSECRFPQDLWSKSQTPLLGAWLFPAFEQRPLALKQFDHG